MWSSFQAFTPRRASVTSSDGIAASIRDSVCLHSGTRIPAFTGSNTVRDEISKALQETCTGLKTAQQALTDSAAVCNAELAG